MKIRPEIKNIADNIDKAELEQRKNSSEFYFNFDNRKVFFHFYAETNRICLWIEHDLFDLNKKEKKYLIKKILQTFFEGKSFKKWEEQKYLKILASVNFNKGTEND